MKYRVSGRRGLIVAFVGVSAVCAVSCFCGEAQPLAPDAAAAMILDSARRAFNEGKNDFAAERFREFLRQYGGHKDAPAAQYGLALSLLELPQKDYPAIVGALQQAVGRQDFSDRPCALYYLGATQRGIGGQALEQAAAKPNEAQNFRNVANQNFNEAVKNFAAAADAFAKRLAVGGAGVPARQDDSPDLEWLALSRCDQCDMLLRLEKFKDAATLADGLLADKALAQSRFRELALYHLGYAMFAQHDYLTAGRALSQLAPFQQEFGVHARYLLSRTHHQCGERPEAAAGYKALLATYDQRKKMAAEALKNPGALTPQEKSRLEAQVKGPPPDYVLRATFYSALLMAEDGNAGPALEALTALAGTAGVPPALLDEIRLRQGFCFVQARNFAEATKVLQPLQNHPQLADRALWWSARAQVGAADPANAQACEQAAKAACDVLNRAADKAGELGRQDPEAKARRGDILLELGDTQQLAKLYREAAGTYQKVVAENTTPVGQAFLPVAEEAMQRQATALHLAGQYKESDDVCKKFEQAYPKSTLLSAVWFRAAENSCLAAIAAVNDPAMRARRPEVEKMLDEAIARYQRLLARYPEFPYANLARYGMATAQYHKGQYAEAVTVLSGILDADRGGDLAPVNYLIADCNIRLLPPETDDAIQAAQLIDRADQAAKLLEKFIPTQGKTPRTADALLKLGHCYQRIGMILIDPAERQKTITKARETYDKVLQEYGQTPAMPNAVLERARCLALLGDPNGAINEYNRFNNDPLRQSPVTPLALIRAGSLMRAQNRLPDAVKILAQCRGQYEGSLATDPDRSAWVPLMQYEHGLALKDSAYATPNAPASAVAAKLAEARAIFEAITQQQFAARAEAANASWRAGQCRREESLVTLTAARAVPFKPGVKPEEIAAATKSIEDSLAALRQAAASLKTEAAKRAVPADKGAQASPESCARMLYEAAWCCRVLADAEIEVARQKLQTQALEKVTANLKKAAPDQAPPLLTPPDLPLSAVPVQPGEKAAQDCYNALIAAAPRSALAPRARLELAELLSQRDQNDKALELLASALEDTPPADLVERIHVRIAACLLAKGDAKTALARTQQVLKNQASPVAPEARYLEGEAHILNKDWANAITQLVFFRDQGPYQNIPGVSDRALLRLGYAFAQAKRWDESRQAYDALCGRFNQSPLFGEARFGIGWAWQNQNQHDNACNAYAEVTRRTAAEVAARAQLQIGLCRLAQKRFPDAAKELLAVPFTYGYPEHSAAALCEAGQAYLEQKKPDESRKVWDDVVKNYPGSQWAETARQRLAALK